MIRSPGIELGVKGLIMSNKVEKMLEIIELGKIGISETPLYGMYKALWTAIAENSY